MPGLYGISSNANISVYNTTGLYNVGNANVVIRGNVGSSNTTGLYQALGNPVILTSAQVLLSLLSQSGNVNFALTNGNTQVLAYDLINTGLYNYYTNANVASYLATNTDPTIQTIFIGQQTLSANLGAFETYANLHFGDSQYGNANVAAYLATNTDPTIQTIFIGQQVLNANLGAFETYANLTFGTSDYSNANVQSYMQHFDANIIPSANATYSLGSSTNWWKDLYLSNNTLYLDGIPLSIINGNLTVNSIQIPGTYSNANVSAYLPTDPTITTIQANIGAFETYANTAIQTTNANLGAFETYANTAIQTTNANLGAFQTYANIHFGDSNYSNVNVAAYIPTDPTITTIQANIGAYQIDTNANLGTATNNIITLFANAGTQADSINSINANLGAFETYANLTFGPSSPQAYGNANVAAYLPTDSTITGIQANLGAYQINTNANIGTITNNLQTLDANVGAYETWANANFGTSTYSNTNVAAYLPTDPTITGIQANIGGSQTYANATFVTQTALQTLDANVGAYEIATNANIGTITVDLQTLNANVGAYEIATNANIGAITIGLQTLNANVGAFETYSNANAAIQATEINTLNANLGAYETWANATFSVSTYSNANVAAYLPIYPGNLNNVYGINASSAIVGQSLGATFDITSYAGNIYANVGTVNAEYFTGNGYYLTGIAVASTYGNANVAAYLPTYTGNLNSVTLNQANVGNYLQFNTVPSAVTWVPGRVFWDTTANTLAYYNDNSQMTVNIGEETIIRVRNQTGADMFNGNVVYIDGATGNTPTANLAIATSFRTADIIGMLTTDIANNGFGYATINGIVNGLNTNAIAAGSPIYVSATTPGQYTTTEPLAPNYSVQVGVVIRSNPSVGSVLVSPQQISTEAQHIVGVLPISSGGTNSNATPTAGAVAFGNGTAFSFTAVGTTGQVLSSNATGTPTWITPYGNTNVAAYIPTDPTIIGIQANLGGFETYANVTYATKTSLQTLDANVGAYEIATDANLGTATTNITTLFSNAAAQADSINSINANLGAFETYANATFGTGGAGTYSNANVASYLPVYGGNILVSNINFTTSNVRIGQDTSQQYNQTIAIGILAGTINQSQNGIAIGNQAGKTNQGIRSVAIGVSAGSGTQGNNAVAIGVSAGSGDQGDFAVAIGYAGLTSQGESAVAIGDNAGRNNQQPYAIAIGLDTGGPTQYSNAISIGSQSGFTNQGAYSIAIGHKAGYATQTANSIAINANISPLNPYTSGLYINPVRNDTGNVTLALYYNTTTKEVTYATDGGGTYGNTQVAAYIQGTILNPFLLSGM